MILDRTELARVPSAAELLDAWERGRAATPAGRAGLLLSLAGPGTAPAELDRLTVGRRNAALLRLRTRLFGDELECLADCPSCGDPLEAAVRAAELLEVDEGLGAGEAGGRDPEPLELRLDGGSGRVRFRPPTPADLAAAVEHGEAAPPALLERCVLEAEGAGPPFPPEVVERIAASMAAADPLAELELAMTCPGCGHRFAAPLDLPAYLWSELDAWARRVLGEVHRLASAYGWSEAEILALGPSRRRAYLDLVER